MRDRHADAIGKAIVGNHIGKLSQTLRNTPNVQMPDRDVTRARCDLLIAADAAFTSGNSKKARDYEIPIMSAAEFLKNCK